MNFIEFWKKMPSETLDELHRGIRAAIYEKKIDDLFETELEFESILNNYCAKETVLVERIKNFDWTTETTLNDMVLRVIYLKEIFRYFYDLREAQMGTPVFGRKNENFTFGTRDKNKMDYAKKLSFFPNEILTDRELSFTISVAFEKLIT